MDVSYSFIKELSQGDAASCATQEATNLDGTAFFGPLCRTSAFANERRSSAEFSQLCVYDVTIHTLTKTARVIVCVHVMHERIPSPRKVSDWLILQLRRAGLPVRPYTLLKSDVTRRDHVSVVMDPMNVGSRIVNIIVNFIRDGTVFA